MMKFIIPKGGKMLSYGKKLVKLKEGEFESSDLGLQELLKKAIGVEVVQEKQKSESKNG